MLGGRSCAPAVFIGDVAIDEYFAAPRWPLPGDKAELATIATYVGGSIANAARVHAGLGGDTEFISLLNHGALTPRMLEDLDAARVGHTHMLYSEQAVDQRNLIFLIDGEHVVFTPDADDLPMALSESALSRLSVPGFVYTTWDRAARLRAPGRGAVDTLSRLRHGGRRFVFDLDVGGSGEQDPELLRGAHLIMMNDRGFEQSFDGSTDMQAAGVFSWLDEHEADVLLHTRAAAGARVYTRESVIDVPGYCVDVVDVTGAGDTLGGSLVWALGEGYELVAAVQFAVAAASRSVMHLGPQGGVAARGEIEEFMAREW